MTRKLWVLNLFVYALIFLGLVTRKGELLNLAIPLLVYLGFAVYFAPEEIRLKVERTLDEQKVIEGRPVRVTIRIVNGGPDLEEVYLEEVISRPVQLIEGEMKKWVTIPAGEEAQWEFTVRGRRGL